MMTKITKGLNGIRRHKKKEGEAINMSKTKEDLQEPDKNLSQFYEQLFEAFHLYTPLDPKAAENQRMINAFVSQPQGNIFSNFQKLEGFAGMNISQLLEVATKVFIN
jgi:ubiquinone/menaquinone biosynthesis C-methylase UbiE